MQLVQRVEGRLHVIEGPQGLQCPPFGGLPLHGDVLQGGARRQGDVVDGGEGGGQDVCLLVESRLHSTRGRGSRR